MRFILILLLLSQPAFAQSRYELENSLRDRAKWKSLGLKEWVTNDPIELARANRGRVQAFELDVIGEAAPVEQLKSLIAIAEAGPKGYDAVHSGGLKRPPKRPTQMTISEIASWVKATPGQPHAIGRYQIIPSTMRELVRRLRVSQRSRFSPVLQDAFADLLLRDAGLEKFLKKQISRRQFMNNIAKIWAGFPTSNGKSYYDGFAGNRATISLALYRRKMGDIFPN